MTEEFFDDTSLDALTAHVDRLLAAPEELSDEACDRLWADLNDQNLRDFPDTYIH